MGVFMAWADETLSDSTSIAKIESEINNLTSGNWDDKIAVAKVIIGSKIENTLSDRSISVDEDNGEVLLDVVVNPDDIFGLCSDYLTLHLIYNDLGSGGVNELYEGKKVYYWHKYEEQFGVDVRRMQLDTNLDDSTDYYRTNWIQKLER